MVLLKSFLGFACIIFFMLGAFNLSVMVVDRYQMHARLLSGIVICGLALLCLVCYFSVPTA